MKGDAREKDSFGFTARDLDNLFGCRLGALWQGPVR
jgi:hypothetical protein